MANRFCGYCRLEGHTRPKCQVLEWQKNIILTLVPRSRKLLHDNLVKAGLGAGALVSVIDGWTGEKIEAIVPTCNFFSRHSGIQYKKRRNSKMVQAIISTYDNNFSVPDAPSVGLHKGDFIRGVIPFDYGIPVYRLSDMSETLYAMVYTKSLRDGGYTPNPDNWREVNIIVPSYESDITDDDLLNGILLHERITGKDRVFTSGIKTW